MRSNSQSRLFTVNKTTEYMQCIIWIFYRTTGLCSIYENQLLSWCRQGSPHLVKSLVSSSGETTSHIANQVHDWHKTNIAGFWSKELLPSSSHNLNIMDISSENISESEDCPFYSLKCGQSNTKINDFSGWKSWRNHPFSKGKGRIHLIVTVKFIPKAP